MCGIAGTRAEGGLADAELVRAMTERLEHRGPDGEGYFNEQGIALGMRRLAIIDPEGGRQPLYNERRDVVVVFNGELYNHAELRHWLARHGHSFRSQSDGEILPHLYEELGLRMFERLNGIFAVAIWDAKEQTLHLARDQFGVKPLYYAENGSRVSFASELRALLADPGISREIDRIAVNQFLTLRFVPSPRTPFEAVRKVRPSSVLSFGPGGRTGFEWGVAPPEPTRSDTEALVEEYAATFERAVVRQLMSDRPVGVMLSGGVDSGAIASVMSRHTPFVRAFTVGFEGGGNVDEIAAAERTAALVGADHQSLIVSDSEYLEKLPDSLVKLEEPVAATSALAVNYVAEMMKPGVPVALCGQGADEPNGGYRRYLGVALAQRLRRVPGARTFARLSPGRKGDSPRARGLATLAARDDLGLLMSAYRVFSDKERQRLYLPDVLESLSDAEPPSAPVERLRKRVADLDPLAQMLYVDTRLSLPDELLLIADKMSMAASVELRVPFLDPDLVRLSESARSSEKVRPRERKALHKEAMRRFLPDDVVYAPKLGWETPMDRWLREDLQPLLREVLLSKGELARELFNEDALRPLIETHADGEADHTRQLFSLLSLGLWYRGLVK